MIFQEGSDKKEVHSWKYHGIAEGANGSIWTFYTDRKSEFEKFRDKKYTMGFRYIEGRVNKYFEIVKKMSEKRWRKLYIVVYFKNKKRVVKNGFKWERCCWGNGCLHNGGLKNGGNRRTV